MRCALARELVHVMLGIEHEPVSDEQPQTMLTGWLVQQAQIPVHTVELPQSHLS